MLPASTSVSLSRDRRHFLLAPFRSGMSPTGSTETGLGGFHHSLGDCRGSFEGVWGAEIRLSCREAVLVDQSAESISSLDAV